MSLFKPLYAVYPGTIATYDEDGDYSGDVTWSAVDLAAAYGVQDEPYLIVNSPLLIPQGNDYFKYLHLHPRADNKYQNIKYVAEDDGAVDSWRPDFDATKTYLQETDKRHIYPDDEGEEKLHSETDY